MPCRLAVVNFLLLSSLSTLALGQDDTPECQSFGVDFQDGGSYFQNISSMSDFTFASIFEGTNELER